MPLYDYSCEEHGQFQKIRKISEREKAECPECGKECKQGLTARAGLMAGITIKMCACHESYT
ncbi:hypothetical protein NPJJOOEL_00007 [Enterobacteria phage Brandy]|nr:hypothetical protein NPJJOOEL_00007 [Enterobacteria phage Brandy]